MSKQIDTLNRKDLIIIAQERLWEEKERKVALSDINFIVNQVFETIKDCLSKDVKVRLDNFGTFHTKTYKERLQPNPKNRSEIRHLPAHQVVKFKPGLGLKTLVRHGLEIE